MLLDEVDGLSITLQTAFESSRVEHRISSRLNVETKNDDLLLVYKIKELENIIIDLQQIDRRIK